MYLQALRRLDANGFETVSSEAFATRVGVTAAQFRKDLSYLGVLGRPGVGYGVRFLSATIADVLGLTDRHRIALVGAGRLGEALCAYPGFEEQGFRISAVFDSSPAKIGQVLHGKQILDIGRLSEVNERLGCDMGIIAVPADAAQTVCDGLVRAGIRWIRSFAPGRVSTPPGVMVRDVDLTHQLEVLSYYARLAARDDRRASDPETDA